MFQSNLTTISNNRYALDELALVKQLYLLGEIQRWINEVSGDLINYVPSPQSKGSIKDGIYLTAAALYNILTEHHHKIQKLSGNARFTIPVVDILMFLREAAQEPVSEVAGTMLFQTIINTGKMIGYDRNNFPTCFFTIISEPGGKVVTAYPGFSVNDEELFK